MGGAVLIAASFTVPHLDHSLGLADYIIPQDVQQTMCVFHSLAAADPVINVIICVFIENFPVSVRTLQLHLLYGHTCSYEPCALTRMATVWASYGVKLRV